MLSVSARRPTVVALAADREMNFWEARPLVDRFRFKRRRNRVDRGVENAASSMITTYNSTQTHKLWIFVFIYYFFLCVWKKKNETKRGCFGLVIVNWAVAVYWILQYQQKILVSKKSRLTSLRRILYVVWFGRLCVFFFFLFFFLSFHTSRMNLLGSMKVTVYNTRRINTVASLPTRPRLYTYMAFRGFERCAALP